MLHAAVQALFLVLEPMRLLIMAGGVLLGLSLGVIPGLGGVVGLAILIPFTYSMDGPSSFALLLGMASVTTVSDLIPAVLFGVPGTVGAAATVMDGHALAKKGQAAQAFGAGYAASLIGGIFGAVLLAVAIPVLRPVALHLASPELLSFCIFGLSMVAVLSGRAPLKGLTAAGLGLMLAMIGADSQTGTQRWTFDTFYLWDHLPLVPLTLGIFAVPELADLAVRRAPIAAGAGGTISIAGQWQGFREAVRHWKLVLRCSALGAMLGAVPGVGSAVIDWIAYGHAVRTEKNPETFGQGDIRGVIAAEASNNAKEGGHLLPTIAFGVPAGASMALLLSAFLMHGFVPGPEMLTKHLDITYSIMWTLTLAHVLGAGICLCASGIFSRLATVRPGILVPLVLSVVLLGAYEGSQSSGDLIALVLFGAVGWVMKRLGWPRPPLILGYVIGGLFERYLFISTQIFGAGWVLRPIVLGVLALSIWVAFRPLRISVIDTVATLRGLRPGHRRMGPRPLFSLGLLAVTACGYWLSRDWPAAANMVPQAAMLVTATFGLLNLVTELFGSAAEEAAESAPAHPPEFDLLASVPTALAQQRALRFFAVLVGFLFASAAIGLLPSLFLMILVLTRFEFHEKWSASLATSTIAITILYGLFDRLFSVPWPQSALGDLLPGMRAMTGVV